MSHPKQRFMKLYIEGLKVVRIRTIREMNWHWIEPKGVKRV